MLAARPRITAAMVVLAAAALAGCGGGGAGQSLDGATIFETAGCSSCHTLLAANATGVVGPDLDRLKPSAAHVRKQVTSGGSGMPDFSSQLTPAQVAAVADYVAQVTGGATASTGAAADATTP